MATSDIWMLSFTALAVDEGPCPAITCLMRKETRTSTVRRNVDKVLFKRWADHLPGAGWVKVMVAQRVAIVDAIVAARRLRAARVGRVLGRGEGWRFELVLMRVIGGGLERQDTWTEG